MAEFTGVLHVHSTFSDGAMSLEAIRDWALGEELDFVCISDHSEHLPADRRTGLIEECERVSGKVLLIPGIEFAHSGRHVIVHGPRECLMGLTDKDAVCRPETVRERGGMTIWAHPALTYALSLHEGIATPYDGWEIWNRKVDGASPNLALVSVLQKVTRERDILSFAGWDLHSNPPPLSGPRLTAQVDGEQLTCGSLVQALQNGAFRVECEEMHGVEGHLSKVEASFGQVARSWLHYRWTRAECVARYLAHRAKTTFRRQERTQTSNPCTDDLTGPGAFAVTSGNITVTEFREDPDTWDRWVRDRPEARFCHQYEWLQLVRDVYGGEPHYLAAYRGDEIAGVMPVMLRTVIGEGRVLISLPLADEGGIIADGDAAEEALLERARDLVEDVGAARLELRQRRPLPGTEVDLSRVNMEMDLPDDAEVLWDDFQGKVRNQVRKAKKSGLTAHVIDDLHAAISDAFYPVYCENTRDLGSPMHSENFFHEVADRFPETSRIVIVSEEETTVGSAYAIRWQSRFAVPWASSLRRYFKMCPNNLLYWELMCLAINSECRIFDFGRSPRDSGTYRFKEQWGAEPVQLHYCQIGKGGGSVVGPDSDSVAKRLFSAVWRKTPLAVARFVGPRIFARLPI